MVTLRESCRTMRITLHLLVLLAISYFVHGSLINSPSGLSTKPFSLTGRIVNGTKAVLRQFPHQVSLMRRWTEKHFCGGSLISTFLVLTAGHCMYLGPGKVIEASTIIVVGGIINLNEIYETGQKKDVLKIRIHPKFDFKTLYNDVAVLQLSEPFTFIPEVHRVPLSGNSFVPNTICQVSGWGYLSSDLPRVSPDLMYVDLPIRTVKECRKLLENVTDLPRGMFCAGYLEGGKDACQGDSGGGMICNGILTGIVSGGKGCAEPLFPGVYADVYHYLNWILKDTDVATIMQNNCRNNCGNYNALNTSMIIVIISLLFSDLINYA